MMVALRDEILLELAPDAALRQQLFGNSVMRHPAKQSLVQLIHLLERFAIPGGVLLDPFGGSGSAMLAASPCYGGMYVITTELAPHFLTLQQQAWQHFQCSLEMQPIWETAPCDYISLAGDSRHLVELLEATDAIDLIITSPSYGGSEAVDRRKKQNTTIAAHGGGNVAKAGYVDTIITSPPYQDALNTSQHANVGRFERGLTVYEPRQQIDRLPEPMTPRWGGNKAFGPNSQLSAKMADYDQSDDLIVTSPPYQDALNSSTDQRKRRQLKAIESGHGDFLKSVGPHSQVSQINSYDTTAENIGNLRGKKYLASMRQVWQQCAQVLKPGGILCCITRDCVQKGRRVLVGEQNKDLLIEAGLTFLQCEEWRVPQMSFWRILQHRKNPEAPLIDTEQVFIFQKPA